MNLHQIYPVFGTIVFLFGSPHETVVFGSSIAKLSQGEKVLLVSYYSYICYRMCLCSVRVCESDVTTGTPAKANHIPCP